MSSNEKEFIDTKTTSFALYGNYEQLVQFKSETDHVIISNNLDSLYNNILFIYMSSNWR